MSRSLQGVISAGGELFSQDHRWTTRGDPEFVIAGVYSGTASPSCRAGRRESFTDPPCRSPRLPAAMRIACVTMSLQH